MVAPEELPLGPMLRTMPESSAMVLEIGGRIDRADIPALCDRVRVALVESRADLVICDVGALTDPDCVAVDALARVALTARRAGCRLRLRSVSPDLQALLRFVGLSDVVPLSATSGLEPGRQTEQREEGLGVEEEDDPADPTA